jgi:hypothetical protein
MAAAAAAPTWVPDASFFPFGTFARLAARSRSSAVPDVGK